MKIQLASAALAIAVASALAATPAQAAVTSFADAQQGSGACQPAREYPDLRMRQKEADNIGDTNVYLVCSPRVHYINGSVSGLTFQFANNSDVERTFRCTMQNDFLNSGQIVANVVREVTVAPGESDGIQFGEGDFVNPSVQLPGVQCILPPSTSLAFMTMVYSELDQTVE